MSADLRKPTRAGTCHGPLLPVLPADAGRPDAPPPHDHAAWAGGAAASQPPLPEFFRGLGRDVAVARIVGGLISDLREHVDQRFDGLSRQMRDAHAEVMQCVEMKTPEPCLSVSSLEAHMESVPPQAELPGFCPDVSSEAWASAFSSRSSRAARTSSGLQRLSSKGRLSGVQGRASKIPGCIVRESDVEEARSDPHDAPGKVVFFDEPDEPDAGPASRQIRKLLRSGSRLAVRGDDEGEDEDCVRRALRRLFGFIRSDAFEYLMGALILANACLLGAQVDHRASSLQESDGDEVPDPRGFSIAESLFGAIFVMELLGRLGAESQGVRRSQRLALRWRDLLRDFVPSWLAFDALVVTTILLEEVLKLAAGDDARAGRSSFYQVLRVGKLLRTLRIFRVAKGCRELRIVMTSITQSARSLFWALLLLGFLMYAVAVLILVELTMFSDAYAAGTDAGGLRQAYYGSLMRTVVTIFQCTTGGLDWREASWSLEEVMPGVIVLWVAYIGLVAFAITNTMTGLFVDQVRKAAQCEHRCSMAENLAARLTLIDGLAKEVRAMADPATPGAIELDSFVAKCSAPEIKRILKGLDIDVPDAVILFEQVVNSQGCISTKDVEDFAHCCARLGSVEGPVTSTPRRPSSIRTLKWSCTTNW